MPSSLDFMRRDDELPKPTQTSTSMTPPPTIQAPAPTVTSVSSLVPRTIYNRVQPVVETAKKVAPVVKDALKESFPDTAAAYQESKSMNPITKTVASAKGAVSLFKEGLVQPLNRLGVGLARNMVGGGTEKPFTPKPGFQQQMLGREEVKPISQELGDTVGMGYDLARQYNPGGEDPNEWSSKVFAASMTPVFALLAGGMKAADADLGVGDVVEKPAKKLVGNLLEEGGEKLVKKGFQGLDNVTLKTIEKMKGKTDVAKQFIVDLAKAPDLKQSERNILNEVLSRYPDAGKVNIERFAKDVEQELLPLSAKDIGSRWEERVLPHEVRGDVDNYSDVVYESPIKTQAGNVHFGGDTENYFGHVRTEDLPNESADIRKGLDKAIDAKNNAERMIEANPDGTFISYFTGEPMDGQDYLKELNDYIVATKSNPLLTSEPNKTRRILEVQSDLMQKGRLDNEVDDHSLQQIQDEIEAYGNSPFAKTKYGKAALQKEADVKKLSQYNNPTAHFRMIREEVKRAAQDGINKVQFPTGETAMKIEGLDKLEQDKWFHNPTGKSALSGGGWYELKPSDSLQVGQKIDKGGDFTTDSGYVVTQVGENGKFKAVPDRQLEFENDEGVYKIAWDKGYINRENGDWDMSKASKDQQILNLLSKSYLSEDFTLRGQEQDPIYQFYEKEVQKYLKSKYPGMQRITDENGVEWFEIPIKPEYGKAPVEAFAAAPLAPIIANSNKKEDKKKKNK